MPYAGELVPIAVNGDIRPTGNPLIGMSALRSTALSPVTTSAWSTPVDMVAIWSRTELLTGTAALAALVLSAAGIAFFAGAVIAFNQQYLSDRDVLPLSVSGAELNALVKQQVAQYRELGREFGLVE